jgi:hypothetical protein
MTTQTEIAIHLGMNQSEVSRHMEKLGINWRTASLQDVRLAYIAHLRGQAAGHLADDGSSLVQERVLTERVDRELKQLTLAEKRGLLVNLQQLEPALAAMVVAFRAELQSRDDKLAEDLSALYGVEVDRALIEEYTRAALDHLARYDPGGARPDPAADGHGASAGEADDDSLGDGASLPVSEGGGEAG